MKGTDLPLKLAITDAAGKMLMDHPREVNRFKEAGFVTSGMNRLSITPVQLQNQPGSQRMSPPFM